jgi:hypothetical protein
LELFILLDAISDWVREELVKCAAKWNKLPSQEEQRIKLTYYLLNTFNNCQQTFQSIETINNFLNSNDYVSVSRREDRGRGPSGRRW